MAAAATEAAASPAEATEAAASAAEATEAAGSVAAATEVAASAAEVTGALGSAAAATKTAASAEAAMEAAASAAAATEATASAAEATEAAGSAVAATEAEAVIQHSPVGTSVLPKRIPKREISRVPVPAHETRPSGARPHLPRAPEYPLLRTARGSTPTESAKEGRVVWLLLAGVERSWDAGQWHGARRDG